MSKTLESIINTRLTWHLKSYNLLSPNQFGFHENRSTINPLITIHTSICDALEKKHLLMVTLDIAEAYDTVWKHSVLSTLQKLNFKENILKNTQHCTKRGNQNGHRSFPIKPSWQFAVWSQRFTTGHQTKVSHHKIHNQKDVHSPNTHDRDHCKTLSWPPPETLLYKASRNLQRNIF